ncbi:MAG: helix-turn-helix domain-containing protein [Chloroflexi bacterium]|nr:PocR ligand-binding domain-containing protein [Anaerolineaceae bacterium]NMB90051.1 helix-turn-helix domain-containing protein [Chloroflexota bacterium]
MPDLLTTREVQEMLKVDRITIYRMLQDGRLKGVKIGQQWRFTPKEVAQLLDGAPPTPSTDAGGRPPFPAHCVQTIQDLFTDLSQTSAIVLDPQGNPLTEMSHPCEFCRQVQSTPQGRQACAQSWQELARAGLPGPFACHAGMIYLWAELQEDGAPVGRILIGPQAHHPLQDERMRDRLQRLAGEYGLNGRDLLRSALDVPVMDAARLVLVKSWLSKLTAAIASILKERAGFVDRLQRIAEMTQF